MLEVASCNIFISVRIIKEMPGSVASGTRCIIPTYINSGLNIACKKPKHVANLRIFYLRNTVVQTPFLCVYLQTTYK